MLRRFEPYTCHVKIPNCIVCDKEFENIAVNVEQDVNQPNNGLTFMTHGHFGTAVFDPMSPDRWLEINICDECITERENRVLHVTKAPKAFVNPVIYEKWNKFKHG